LTQRSIPAGKFNCFRLSIVCSDDPFISIRRL